METLSNKNMLPRFNFKDCRDFYNLKNLVRFNNKMRVKNESVAEHSYFVALYTEMICEHFNFTSDQKLKALRYALYHDVPEIWLSDIPHNVKAQNKELERCMQALEEKCIDENLPSHKDVFECDSFTKLIVDTADIISVIVYVETEKSLGNETLDEIYYSAIERYENIMEEIKNA